MQEQLLVANQRTIRRWTISVHLHGLIA